MMKIEGDMGECLCDYPNVCKEHHVNLFHGCESVSELLGMAVGAGSVAWHPNKDGKIFANDVVFNDEHARRIVDDALARLEELT